MKRFFGCLALPVLAVSLWLPMGAASVSSSSVGDVVISGMTQNESLPRVEFSGSYPVLSGMPRRDREIFLNRKMLEMEQAALARAKAAVLALAPDDGSGRAVEAVFGYEVKRNGGGLVSLLFHDYLFSGGANGLTVKTGLTFSVEDGRILALKDLFRNESSYRSVIDDAIRKQLAQRDLEGQLLKAFTGMTGQEAFYLTDSELVIVIQETEWFPHAMGSVEFPIPLSDVSVYLQDFAK